MLPRSLTTIVRSLRFRLLLWNAGAVLLTGACILLAVRQGVRYTLVLDLDQVLREDLKEIELHFQPGEQIDWPVLQEELNLKAQGHDYHGWFVQFYDAQDQPIWSSVNTPSLPPLTAPQKRQGIFSVGDYRLSYRPLPRDGEQAVAATVGVREAFITRDMARIDRLVTTVFGALLIASPLAGWFLTNRTIQPLASMIRTTSRLRPGELEDRMPLRGTGDELDRLAQTINGLLDRISSYLEQEHDFLAHAAHELRTPLAAIRSSVEVALNGDRSETEYRELLSLVIEQCSALQTLVNQLLLLAETDADRLKTDAEPVALDQVVQRAVEMFQGVAEFHGITLQTKPLPPVAVAGNRHHLRQVLNNLLDNAIKFTAAKASEVGAENCSLPLPPEITVTLSSDQASGTATLTVADQGIGIDSKSLPHIFDRFYRADQVRSREGMSAGTGLGLSICRAIVEAHHGTISAESTIGRETKFIIVLPQVRSSSRKHEITAP
ncbi:MAG TPA: HAMP domain-containing sensor histidine kinase [Pirellulaceae bacterium]|nr:HAMP domain-containing sensor histidine kinase [Pirellulaceae bacterium]